ncbi:hypothetical protein K502DRAFT_343425 [Neoconidiobolus thromboides FSU 785]|nr:hypothetical protein K502DRAFT_343425 [Neoconidiobolus thromboides FSU 785]
MDEFNDFSNEKYGSKEIVFMEDEDDELGEFEMDKREADNKLEFEGKVKKPIQFHLEDYILDYEGEIKYKRLEYLIKVCPELKEKALFLLLKSLREETLEYERYLKHYNEYHAIIKSSSGNSDKHTIKDESKWIEDCKKYSKEERDRIETLIRNSKKNNIMESIRLSYFEAGELEIKLGDIEKSIIYFNLSKEYSSNDKTTLQCILKILELQVKQSNFKGFNYLLHRVKSIKNIGEKEQSFINCINVLKHLQSSEYKQVLTYLVKIDEKYEDDFKRVISTNDLAMIGTLCILATYNRKELKQISLKSSPIKALLDNEPVLKDLLYDFSITRYSKGFMDLENLKDRFLLDIYLAPRVNALFDKIFVASVMAYTSPFQSLKIERISSQFNLPHDKMEKLLIEWISNDELKARVDIKNKVLYNNFNLNTNVFQDTVLKHYNLMMKNQILLTNSIFALNPWK